MGITINEILSAHPKADYANAMVKDGWVIDVDETINRSQHPSQRVIIITKELPGGASILAWLTEFITPNVTWVDRKRIEDYSQSTSSLSENMWVNSEKNDRGYYSKQLSAVFPNDLEYSWDNFEAAINTCPVCNDVVGHENLQRVAFANAACVKCAPDLRAKLERPGWAD